MTNATQDAYERLLAEAEERSERLGDPCKHLTRCADMACNYRMEDAERRALDLGEAWREVDIHGSENPELVQVDGQGKWLRGWVEADAGVRR